MYRANKTEKDVLYILDNLRIEDLEELKALWGENWKEQTLKNIMETEFSVMLGKTKDKDIPVVMGGVWRTDRPSRGMRRAVGPCRVQAPESPSSVAFRDIASDMLYWQRSESEAGGVEHFMQQLLHLSQRITPNVLRA